MADTIEQPRPRIDAATPTRAPALDPLEFRRVMGRFATGVAVIDLDAARRGRARRWHPAGGTQRALAARLGDARHRPAGCRRLAAVLAAAGSANLLSLAAGLLLNHVLHG